jgi:DNA-binding beta-propeller fold protein YncE
MKNFNRFASALLTAGTVLGAAHTFSAFADDYKVVNTAQIMGTGRIDYVYADSDGRKLYVPRGKEVLAFDLDTLKPAGSITNAQAHGVAVDPVSHHGFCSSKPVVMWDSKTLDKVKTIDVQGGPDAIVFEPLTEKVYVLSHSEPNATVVDGKDGSILGTIDLGGAPEQAASDENGNLYINLEDKDSIAVVDVKTMKLKTTYSLGGKGGGPSGLALDAKNHVLFCFCNEPAVCVVLSADDGKILTTLPIGKGNDSATFNPATMEAFGSQRDGTLTVIKETSPTAFEVAQTVKTKQGAKTCTLDTKNNQVIVITLERPAGAPAPSPDETPAARRARGNGPGMLDIIVVGK